MDNISWGKRKKAHTRFCFGFIFFLYFLFCSRLFGARCACSLAFIWLLFRSPIQILMPHINIGHLAFIIIIIINWWILFHFVHNKYPSIQIQLNTIERTGKKKLVIIWWQFICYLPRYKIMPTAFTIFIRWIYCAGPLKGFGHYRSNINNYSNFHLTGCAVVMLIVN